MRSTSRRNASHRGLDARRIQPLQREQAGRVAMLDEFVAQAQLQDRHDDAGRLQGLARQHCPRRP